MRPKRHFTDDYKAEVVEIILGEGRSIRQVCQELELTESAVRRWVQRARLEQGGGGPGRMSSDEREELKRLRREVRQLRLEREVLKKATAFFAKESS